MAHELGHGVHQMLARDQGPLLAPTPLTLAETASARLEELWDERGFYRTTAQHDTIFTAALAGDQAPIMPMAPDTKLAAIDISNDRRQ